MKKVSKYCGIHTINQNKYVKPYESANIKIDQGYKHGKTLIKKVEINYF